MWVLADSVDRYLVKVLVVEYPLPILEEEP